MGRVAMLSVMLTACGGGGGGSSSTASATSAPTVSQQQIDAQMVSADASTLTSIDPATASDTDLAAFGNAVGSHSIVLLTEATHGDGNTFDLKTRLVKYLHEQKGFNVLFMESGMYDVVRMQQRLAAGGSSLSTQAPGRIYYMYSRTTAGQQVLQYVDSTLATATPLALWGHDIPMNGTDSTTSLLPNLQSFLSSRNSSLPASADWPGYLRVAQQAVALNGVTLNPADSTSFLNMSTLVVGELCASQPDTATDLLQSVGFWCRIAHGVQADYTHLWSATDARTPTDLRDITGAGNIQWLLNGRLQGQKAIVWLHALHGINGEPGTSSCAAAASQECGPGWTNVGTNLVNAYGAQVYITHITAGQGTFDTYNTVLPCGASGSGAVLPGLNSNMLEYYLAAGNNPMFMPYPTDSAGQSNIAGLSIFESEFQQSLPNSFGKGYQGLFFLPQLSPITTDCTDYPALAYP
jgi:erythromycin esterase